MIYSFRNYIMDVFIIASHYCTAPAKTHTHTHKHNLTNIHKHKMQHYCCDCLLITSVLVVGL